jgi:hypothetical protein
MKKKVESTAVPIQSFSFDTEAVIFMAAFGYLIRKEIENTALEMSENKKSIPKSTIIKAMKKIGFGEWVGKVES